MKTLVVAVHPRVNSLTFAVTGRFIEGLKQASHEVELLDLYRENFNPVLFEQDEPAWGRPDKRYSAEVGQRIEQMKRNDALAFVFPIWWYSMPAIMKGYIDRVWNYGFAYGNSKLPHKKVLWIGLVGEPKERFQKHKHDELISHYFNANLAGYTGIKSSEVVFLYNTINEKKDYFENEMLPYVYELGLNY